MMIILSRARSRLSAIALAGVVALTLAAPAQAAGSSMPWEAPLQAILESIQGPVAKIVAVIIIIATGLAQRHQEPLDAPHAHSEVTIRVIQVLQQHFQCCLAQPWRWWQTEV